jgi:uncharacterized protein (TIGR02145 family)
MVAFVRPILTAVLGFALAFTLYCSGGDPVDSGDGGGGGGNGNCSGGDGNNGSLTYEGQTYKTVQIGCQKWMAENLNYAAGGSLCYDNDPANCAEYGRLYDWVTAMALDAGCASTSCSSKVNTKHRGICPAGWHIPSNADWGLLLSFASMNGSSSGNWGAKLKTTSGWDWNDYDDKDGNGTDEFGFSALPGGGNFGSRFSGLGKSGLWRTASERSDNPNDVTSPTNAYIMNMSNRHVRVDGYRENKESLISLRCVLD